MSRSKMHRAADIGLYVLFAVLICVLLLVKADYHVDELLNYNLSNTGEFICYKGFPLISDGVRYSPASKPFADSLSSQGFDDLAGVWHQKVSETHHPLYYFLVHLACSFSPGRISMRPAGAINIVFILLTFFVYRKILMLLIDDRKIEFALSLAFCLSAGILNITSFLRMYVMVMFLVTAITYHVLKGVEKFRIRDYVIISAVSLCGALTHYYFLVYAFFISVCICVLMLKTKRFRDTVFYCISMAVAGGIYYAVIPDLKSLIGSSGNTTRMIDNIENTSMWTRFKVFYDLTDQNMFGGLLGAILLITAVLIIISVSRSDGESCRPDGTALRRITCILLPSLGYLIVVSKSAEYEAVRYASPIFAVIFAGVMCLLYISWKNISSNVKHRDRIYIVFVSAAVIAGILFCDWKFLYLQNREKQEQSMQYRDHEAIVVYDNLWKVLPSYLEIRNCEAVTFYNAVSYSKFDDAADTSALPDRIAFFCVGIDGDRYISDFLNANPGYEVTDDIEGIDYCHVYYVGRS